MKCNVNPCGPFDYRHFCLIVVIRSCRYHPPSGNTLTTNYNHGCIDIVFVLNPPCPISLFSPSCSPPPRFFKGSRGGAWAHSGLMLPMDFRLYNRLKCPDTLILGSVFYKQAFMGLDRRGVLQEGFHRCSGKSPGVFLLRFIVFDKRSEHTHTTTKKINIYYFHMEHKYIYILKKKKK